MPTITFTHRLRMTGDAVADLHTALTELGFDDAERAEKRFGPSTRDAVRKFQEKYSLRASGDVDEATARKLNELLRELETEPSTYRVSGEAVRANGTPVEGVEIRLLKQGITRTTPLGEPSTVKTDPSGKFEFEYPRPETSIDLRVELVADPSREIAETRPELISGASPDERITFVVGDEVFRGRSSFERLESTLAAALAGEGLEPRAILDFDQAALARLSIATGETPSTLVLLRQAYGIAKETGFDAAILFGMGHAGKLNIASTEHLLVQGSEQRRAAVKRALEVNDIPARLEKQASELLDTLDERSLLAALENPAAPNITSVGTLLEDAGLDPGRRRKLAEAYLQHTGTPPEFWQQVQRTSLLSEEEVGRVQFELQLALVTQNHAPLNRALKARGVVKLQDLAKLDRADWLALIRGNAAQPGTALPADLEALGTTPEQYADLIGRTVEDAIPSALVAERAERLPDAPRLQAFFEHNSAFDLRRTALRTYLESNPNALGFAGNEQEARAVTSAVKRVQRAYRLSPPGKRIATTEVLLQKGLDSAHRIRSLGRAAFIQRTEVALGGRAEAEEVFRRASNAAATVAMLAARHSPALNSTPFWAAPNPATSSMLVAMFGSQDFCSCEHCQSVYSPAAYLVDTLRWLDELPSELPLDPPNPLDPEGKKPVLDLLLERRRADIAGIELSCSNTHTPLPYIDLVNEVLELLVAPPVGAIRYQTTASTSELRAHPEHLRMEAYEILAGTKASTEDAVYPFHLPFNLWLEEARVYLAQLGTTRARLMEALQGAAAAGEDRGVAIETLGVSPLEWDIMAGQAQQRTVAEFWGLGSDSSFVAKLKNVSHFLAQAAPALAEDGLPYNELTELLRTDFVQKPAQVKVVFTGTNCATERAELDGLTEAHLERMHRFLRLQRRLNWSTADLDRAITIFGQGTLDESCLQKIAHASQLALETKLPLAELLSWWGPLDTRRWRLRLREHRTGSGFELMFDDVLEPSPTREADASAYDRLFQNRALHVEASDAFGINLAGLELLTPLPGGLPGQLTTVASALGVTVEELGELLPRLGQAPATLNLAHLSALYRHVSLARSLELSARELITLIALTGIDPFDATVKPALTFLREVRFIRESAFSIDELDYLLRHTDTRPASLEPEDPDIGLVLWEIAESLRKMALDADLAGPVEPPWGPTTDRQEFSVVIARLASAVSLDVSVAAPLLRQPMGNGESLLSTFTAPALAAYDRTEVGSGEPILPSPADLPDQFAAFKHLRNAAFIVSRLRIDKLEIGWILSHGPARGTLDLLALSVEPNPSSVPYAAWRRLVEAVQLRDRWSPRRVFDLFEVATSSGAQLNEFLQELSRRSGWALADVEYLARSSAPNTAGPLGFTFPEDWKDERPFVRLSEVMAVVRRVGLSAETLWDWRKMALPTSETPAALASAASEHARQASEIKQAVRGRHDGSRWYEVAPKLRDHLRERQRDALAGWLIGNRGFQNTSALSNHLLLDVQMSPCQLTSRIRQAIGSVQLFVQRILLGLEQDEQGKPTIILSKDAAEEWTWHRLYRVWEANRKVFLYPENWLEPELRDDKTPFFKELENELLQNEVTNETAEAALRHYLQKLDDVARPEVIGLHEFKDDKGVPTLHVFGRTRNTPATYYYRKRVGNGAWTPWEQVEAGIEGSHLLPYVFNRRLYVFWLMITEAALEEENVRYYQLRLAWTEQRDGAWTPKRIGEEFIDARTEAALQRLKILPGSSPNDFFLVASAGAGDLFLDVIRQGSMGYALRPVSPPPNQGGSPEHGDLSDPGVFDPGTPAISYQSPCVARFQISGCNGTISATSVTYYSGISSPDGMRSWGQRFRSDTGASLTLAAAATLTSQPVSLAVLTTPGLPFEVVPSNMSALVSSNPFFLQDTRRTFLVTSEDKFRIVRDSSGQAADWTDLDTGMMLSTLPGRPQPTDVSPRPSAAPALASTSTALPTLTGGLLRLLDPSNSLETSYRARASTIAGRAPRFAGSTMHVSAEVVVVDAEGQELTRARTGRAPRGVEGASSVELHTTIAMPPLTVAAPITVPTLTRKWVGKRFTLEAFYHPYVCLLRRELNRFGLDGLYDPALPPQGTAPGLIRQTEKDDTYFASQYSPKDTVAQPYPIEEFDFDFSGPYSIYNWELYFHAPFSIACQLSQNQHFEEARKWFHRIFDPTESDGGDAPQRFWKVKPLFELFNDENDETGPIAELLLLLHYEGSDPKKHKKRQDLIEQIADMRANPFNPHALARLRLAVYARSVVMKYIDNLIEWGDHLFRQDTMESISEATQLYILASQLLGRRPRQVDREAQVPKTFAELRAEVDPFGNVLVELEGLLPEITNSESDVYENDVELLGGTFYFCIPPNDKLLTDYWGRVADRLFKLRHCMNIEGVVRQLPLFEPPIDPALLVRARAAGLDLASALSDLNVQLPHYRYQVLAQKALELASDVRSLGQALLAALEKKDAEELSLVRAGHQVKLEDALLDVRKRQVEDAKESLAALWRSKESAKIRRDYYRTRRFTSLAEKAQFGLSVKAGILEDVAGRSEGVASALGLIPDFEVGSSGLGGPVATSTFGGTHLAAATRAASAMARADAGILERAAQLSGLMGSYQRRADDWQHQGDLAEKDVDALEHQILGAEIRLAIAEKELANLTLQLEQSKETEALLRDKYTNLQLYQWMVSQISSLHFQAYQLAYDLAKRAQETWRFEMAKKDVTFIQFGYWDSLKKGLLAGDRLYHDLKRMDVAYLDANEREYELVRHVSLRELDPSALLDLKQTGSCDFSIPEQWFDLVAPGHYMRRIKTVSLSLPSVTGPYVSVPCKLTLTRNEVRTSSDVGGALEAYPVARDSVMTSHAQEDSGLFETSLRDERYLPFEGAGVISSWKLELPHEFRPFDYSTISDAILHMRYTARDGGDPLKEDANTRIRTWLEGGFGRVLLSARVDFADAWASFLAPPASQIDQAMSLPIDKGLLPHFMQRQPVQVEKIDLFLGLEDLEAYQAGSPLQLTVGAPGGTENAVALTVNEPGPPRGLPHGAVSFENNAKPLGNWSITFNENLNVGNAGSVTSTSDGHTRLNANAVRDLFIAIRYRLS